MTPLSESCRMVRGSRQAMAYITSEQRTEPLIKAVGCAGIAPVIARQSAGKPEQEWYRRGLCAFVSYEAKALLF